MPMIRSIAPTEIDMFDIELESYNYEALAMLCLLEDQKLLNTAEIQQMLNESQWIQECLESGVLVPLTEASKISDIIQKIKEWIGNIIYMITHDASERSAKYAPWVEDYADELNVAAAKYTGSIKILPLNEGKYREDAAKCATALSKGINDLTSNDDSCSYAKDIVDPEKVASGDKDLGNYIKTYFRIGKKDTLDGETKIFSGAELVKLVENCCEYIKSYNNVVKKNITTITNAYNYNKISNILSRAADDETKDNADNQSNTESISPYQYISVEDKMICESILTTLFNYSAIVEETKPAETGKNNEEQVSPTKVEATEDPKNSNQDKSDDKKSDNNNAEQNGDENSEKTSVTAKYRKLERFAKLVITNYASVCDERLLLYVNILKKIAKSDNIPLPKYTKDGAYISSKEHHAKKAADEQKKSDEQDAQTEKDTEQAAERNKESKTENNDNKPIPQRTMAKAINAQAKAKKYVNKYKDKVKSDKDKKKLEHYKKIANMSEEEIARAIMNGEDMS